MTATFVIPGTPIAKKRPRFVGHAWNSQGAQMDDTRWLLKKQSRALSLPIPKGVPVSLKMLFVFPIPESWSKKKKASPPPHTSKPDGDNVEKYYKDCMTKIIWHDDCQVNECSKRKEYGENPRTELTVEWGSA